MNQEATAAFVAAVEDAYPDAFRTVIHYELVDGRLDHETLQVREDVRERYSDAERERAAAALVEDAAFEATDSTWHEHLPNDGPLHFSIRVFGSVSLIHCARGPDGGGFVASVDTRVSPFVQRLVEKLDEAGE
ncbi:hypothetical protein [Salarchaeum japonicum]|uniref:Uncharacterized protein n=1 Tax=Salarchaeum japonicum TaxID=555573 RepID=A0AAV3SZD1_9EURY|nr:hypothetical protein [Salarchaeum japonicum]